MASSRHTRASQQPRQPGARTGMTWRQVRRQVEVEALTLALPLTPALTLTLILTPTLTLTLTLTRTLTLTWRRASTSTASCFSVT